MHTITQIKSFTLSEAIRYLRSEQYDHATYRAAERTVVAAGLCPSCISQEDGAHRVKLNPWEPGNYYEHAGRQCPDCEEFFVCGQQPEYEPDPWNGDHDPGL